MKKYGMAGGGETVTTGGSPGGDSGMSAISLFDLLWRCLADIMGTAAAAALVRRALMTAAGRRPGLADVAIVREGLEYKYDLPQEWQAPLSSETRTMLRELVRDLVPLLVELTGPIVVRRLRRVTPLSQEQVVGEEEIAHWLRAAMK